MKVIFLYQIFLFVFQYLHSKFCVVGSMVSVLGNVCHEISYGHRTLLHIAQT